MVDVDAKGLEETNRLAAPLAGTHGENLSAHLLDITDREKVEAFPQVVIKYHGKVDGLFNNAGIIQPFVPVNDLGYDTIDRIMNINFYGALHMVKAFLPHLLQRPEAHIANVSSMGGFIPFPGQTFYGASKAAVKLLTEGLYAELQNTPVKVTVIFPGAVNTNIMANSGVSTSWGTGANSPMLEASKAAEIMIKGIEKNKFRVLVGSDARMMDILYRLNPARAVRFIVKQMGKMMM